MGISLRLDYIKTIPGILKIIQIVLLFLAFCLTAAFSNGGWTVPGVGLTFSFSSSNLNYFVAISVIIWIFSLVHFFLSLFGIYESINIPKKNLMVGILLAVLALLLLIGASLAADYAANISCQATRYSPSCGTLDAGVAFGFFALLALVFESVFHIFTELQGHGSGGSTAPPAQSKEEPVA